MIRYRQQCECGALFEVEASEFGSPAAPPVDRREIAKDDLIEWAVNHGKVCSITGVKP